MRLAHSLDLRLKLSLLCLALMMPAAQRSMGAAPLVIEVSSVKPSDVANCREYPAIDGHYDRVNMSCVRIKFLIQLAYDVRDFQIYGSPGWLESDRYDIAAK